MISVSVAPNSCVAPMVREGAVALPVESGTHGLDRPGKKVVIISDCECEARFDCGEFG